MRVRIFLKSRLPRKSLVANVEAIIASIPYGVNLKTKVTMAITIEYTASMPLF